MARRLRLLGLITAILAVGLVAPDPVAADPAPTKVYGVTIDGVTPLDDILAALRRHAQRPTVRIVFDEGMPARYYAAPVARIGQVAGVMGEILDSSAMADYSTAAFRKRVDRYLDRLNGVVDIWEIGNEVNGDWLGSTSATVAKMTYAFDAVRARGGVTALTLYYNHGCSDAAHEMFDWAAAHVPARMRQGLDYVWVSYYEDDCNGLQPDWPSVFDRLHAMFPNSKIGIGECGTQVKVRKAALVDRYYGLRVATPNFVGGGFWWYYRQDAVPHGKPLWARIDSWFR